MIAIRAPVSSNSGKCNGSGFSATTTLAISLPGDQQQRTRCDLGDQQQRALLAAPSWARLESATPRLKWRKSKGRLDILESMFVVRRCSPSLFVVVNTDVSIDVGVVEAATVVAVVVVTRVRNPNSIICSRTHMGFDKHRQRATRNNSILKKSRPRMRCQLGDAVGIMKRVPTTRRHHTAHEISEVAAICAHSAGSGAVCRRVRPPARRTRSFGEPQSVGVRWYVEL